MIVRIGTISELTGKGYEILIDVPTREIILARFYDGKLITKGSSGNTEATLVLE